MVIDNRLSNPYNISKRLRIRLRDQGSSGNQ